MLQTILLVCAVSIYGGDCDETNAIDVIAMTPARAAQCEPIAGQATIARLEIKPELGKSYLKVACRRVQPTP